MAIKLQDAIKQVETLSQDEQYALIAAIVEKLRVKAKQEIKQAAYSWKAAIGTVPFPLTGEDAQTWVTQSRAEVEEDRERIINSVR